MTETLVESDVWALLRQVKDPEIPVLDVVEMGIVRGVHVHGDRVTVEFTPTFSGCPALEVIKDDIEAKVRQSGAREVQVKPVLYPPWTTDWMTCEAKTKLERFGIAPPGRASGLVELATAPRRCPRCSTLDTRVTASFGSTLCKSAYVCNVCREPFEAFKEV